MRRRTIIITISILLAVAFVIPAAYLLRPGAVAPAWLGRFAPAWPGRGPASQTDPQGGGDLSAFTSKGVQTVAHFSTVSSLILYDDFSDSANVLRFEAVWAEAEQILQRIDKAVSISIGSSDIARFNALAYGESVGISSDTASMVQAAKAAYRATDGLFDPTVYPLVDLWGFTPRFNTNDYAPSLPYDRIRGDAGFPLPDEKYIAAFLKLVDFGKVVLSGDEQSGYTLTKLIPPVMVDGIQYQAQLDFGGIAKGYAVDCVTRLLQARGYAYGSFSCGGSSVSLLKNASQRSRENGTFRFNLGLSKPRKGQSEEAVYMSIATRDARLSSSGDYDHAYKVGDAIYCHIIHPKTGYPMNTPVSGVQRGIAVLTLLGGDGDFDDAMTTALCVMGFESALRFFNTNLKDYRMTMVLYSSEQAFLEVVTNVPAAEFTINDPAYVLASHIDGTGAIVYDGSLLR